MCEPTTLERITDLVMTLPEDRAREVLLFAEFMTTRQEDEEDLADAREAITIVDREEEGTVPWPAIKAEHGL